MTAPLMPKATAVWLVENTTLTFRQVAVFCQLHELEIQAIADGDIAYNIVGMNPVIMGQLTLEEIKRCEANSREDLKAAEMERNVKARNQKAKKVLSPSQRADKPAAILWVVRNYPEIIVSQICKLIGTTKSTIEKIKTGEYKDIASLKPKNPVATGLCTEKDLEAALKVSKSYNEPKKKVAKKKTVAKKVATKKVKEAKVKVEKKAVAKKSPVKKVSKTKTEKKASAKKTVAVKAEKKVPVKTVKKEKIVKEKKTTTKAVKAPAKKVAKAKAEKKTPVKK